MTVQIISTVVGILSGGFLLWCLAGFTRALRQGRRFIGWAVQVVKVDTEGFARGNIQKHTGFRLASHPKLQLVRSGDARVPASPAKRTAVLTGLAVLLKSRRGRSDAGKNEVEVLGDAKGREPQAVVSRDTAIIQLAPRLTEGCAS